MSAGAIIALVIIAAIFVIVIIALQNDGVFMGTQVVPPAALPTTSSNVEPPAKNALVEPVQTPLAVAPAPSAEAPDFNEAIPAAGATDLQQPLRIVTTTIFNFGGSGKTSNVVRLSDPTLVSQIRPGTSVLRVQNFSCKDTCDPKLDTRTFDVRIVGVNPIKLRVKIGNSSPMLNFSDVKLATAINTDRVNHKVAVLI